MQNNYYDCSSFLSSMSRTDDSSGSVTSSVIKNHLICPLTNKLMHDPVRGKCGHYFERKAIVSLFGQAKEIKCPCHECDEVIKKNTLRGSNFVWEICNNVLERWRIKSDRELLSSMIGKSSEELIVILDGILEARNIQDVTPDPFDIKIMAIKVLIQEKSEAKSNVLSLWEISYEFFAESNFAVTRSNYADRCTV